MPSVSFDDVSGAFQRQIRDLRRPVSDLARSMGLVRERSKEIAPKVIALFDKLKAEYAGLSFVDYARMFDASVPTHAADRDGVVGYRNHKVYYTLDYMRRLVNLRPRGRQGVRDSATDALARTLATVLQVVRDTEPVWKAIQAEFGFGERLMTRLRKRVEDTKPLFQLPGIRPVQVGAVVHMDRVQGGQVEQEEVVAAPARRARRAA